MSQYMHFFVRKGDNFLPIGTYSRNTTLYEALSLSAPYEAIRPLTMEKINEVISTLIDEEKHTEDTINSLEKKNKLIATFNNSTEEKMELINENDETIEDAKDYLKELSHTIGVLNTYASIIEESLYGWEELEGKPYVYYGIECFKPFVTDIKE